MGINAIYVSQLSRPGTFGGVHEVSIVETWHQHEAASETTQATLSCLCNSQQLQFRPDCSLSFIQQPHAAGTFMLVTLYSSTVPPKKNPGVLAFVPEINGWSAWPFYRRSRVAPNFFALVMLQPLQPLLLILWQVQVQL